MITQLEAFDGNFLLVRGAGGTFCAGADLNVVQKMSSPAQGAEMCQYMTHTLNRMLRLPLVSVACIEGYALGGGAELATACDYRIMDAKSTIRFKHATMGLTPGWGGAKRLHDIVSRRDALRLLTTAQSVDPVLALRIGLCDHVADSDMQSAALRFLEPFLQIAQSNPKAVRAAKRIIAAADSPDFPATEAAEFGRLWGSEENLSAVSATLDGLRKPGSPKSDPAVAALPSGGRATGLVPLPSDPQSIRPLSPRFSAFRPHPWHGVDSGPDAPEVVTAYIEITPYSTVKYECDKGSGFLKVDRPQRMNALPPTLYGFVPRTYCGAGIAALAGAARGDGDPLDICVISERTIDRADILLRARVVGGLLMVDNGEADDKIVAVLEGDAVWGDIRELASLPAALVARLRHYFETYKLEPGKNPVRIHEVYGRERALKVVRTSLADYTSEIARSDAH